MNKIEIDNPREWVYGDYPEGFEEVETYKDYDTLYKDMCSASTIFRRKSDNTYWSLDWDSYESHYGSGESQYDNNFIYQVEQVVKVVETKEWKIKE